MLNFKKEKVNIDDKLKQRIGFICKFCGFKPTFELGYIISLDKTNLYYIEPNKAIIKDILILFFNYSCKYQTFVRLEHRVLIELVRARGELPL